MSEQVYDEVYYVILQAPEVCEHLGDDSDVRVNHPHTDYIDAYRLEPNRVREAHMRHKAGEEGHVHSWYKVEDVYFVVAGEWLIFTQKPKEVTPLT